MQARRGRGIFCSLDQFCLMQPTERTITGCVKIQPRIYSADFLDYQVLDNIFASVTCLSLPKQYVYLSCCRVLYGRWAHHNREGGSYITINQRAFVCLMCSQRRIVVISISLTSHYYGVFFFFFPLKGTISSPAWTQSRYRNYDLHT